VAGIRSLSTVRPCCAADGRGHRPV